MNPINPNFKPSYVQMDSKTTRQYYLSGNADVSTYPDKKLPILLLFPGGSEVPYNEDGKGILNFTELYKVNALVVTFLGQSSKNTFTFINAFPWIISPPKDDVLMVQKVLDKLPDTIQGVSIHRAQIFASGKSNGLGFCNYLACYHPEIGIKAIAGCSGAFFGTQSVDNFGRTPNENIALPASPFPILEMHGTADSTMPIQGENFVNTKAGKSHLEYWLRWDPTVQYHSVDDTVTSNTFTANIYNYWNRWAKVNATDTSNPKKSKLNSENVYSWQSSQGPPTVFIEVLNGQHNWFGHTNSGSGSSSAASLKIDATVLVCHFFEIAYPYYIPTVDTPVTNIPTYSTSTSISLLKLKDSGICR